MSPEDGGGPKLADRGAFTLIELAVVTVVVAVPVAVLLPAVMGSHHHRPMSYCVSNLKQVGLAIRIFANDNNERPPWQVSTNEDGSREFVDVPFSAFQHFRGMSNELSTPRLPVCDVDRERKLATNFSALTGNRKLNYFVGLDASDLNPAFFLSDDRFLGSSRAPINGLLKLSPSSSLSWTNNPHKFGGNLVMGDGSVQEVNSRGLLQLLRTNGLATNRLALPLLPP
jgi:type II secretory pathway pseudopilin PulG